jgi:microcystin-dependent protein
MAIGLNHDTQIAKPGEEIVLQVGSIFSNARSTAPSGYLLCDGSAISRITYSRLFGVIGTTYGSGDGSTTFAIPDLRGAVPRGAGTSSGYTQNVTLTLGAKNNDTIQGHEHNLVTWTTEHYGYSNNWGITWLQYTPGDLTGVSGSASSSIGSPIFDGTNGTPRISNETQTKNQVVNFFIKF